MAPELRPLELEVLLADGLDWAVMLAEPPLATSVGAPTAVVPFVVPARDVGEETNDDPEESVMSA